MLLAADVIYGESCGGSSACCLIQRGIMNHLLLKRNYKIKEFKHQIGIFLCHEIKVEFGKSLP